MCAASFGLEQKEKKKMNERTKKNKGMSRLSAPFPRLTAASILPSLPSSKKKRRTATASCSWKPWTWCVWLERRLGQSRAPPVPACLNQPRILPLPTQILWTPHSWPVPALFVEWEAMTTRTAQQEYRIVEVRGKPRINTAQHAGAVLTHTAPLFPYPLPRQGGG